MKIQRKIHYQIFTYIILFSILFSGCKKMLDVTPANKKTRQEFWAYKEDVEAAMVGCYNGLQTAMKRFFAWSEVRGEIIQINTVVPNLTNDWLDNQGLFEMNQQSIDEKNNFAKWNDVYGAINRINTVIKFAPVAQKNDETFSIKELNYYIGECKTLRALCYFYLARTFYQFPYITVAAESDQQNYQISPIDGKQAMDSIINDLLSAETLVRKNFDTLANVTDDIKLAYNKGRVSLPVVCAILTDVYLTNNQYDKAVAYANKVDLYGTYQLLPGSQWFTIFSPGNSDEGIFELQYSSPYNQGDFAKWFSNYNGGTNWFGNRFNRNTQTYKYWEGDDYKNISTFDIRGANATYVINSKTTIWKWAGKVVGGDQNNARGGDSWDAHYIFYRYSDILLMKAEALNQLGQSDAAAGFLLAIRQRAGYRDKSISYGSKDNLEDMILDERARELAFEGKRWFDLVRIAKRRNDYTVIAKRIADFNATPMDQTAWYAKVSDPLSWYIPIFYTELELNKYLKQNPFYQQ